MAREKANAVPWDMAIIGAGPAGSICAYSALATSGAIRVALIDRETFPRNKACGDAIPYEAVPELKELGLEVILDGRPEIRRIQVTCPEKFGYLKKLFENYKVSYYFVERLIFDNYLFESAIRKGAYDCTGYQLTDGKYDESDALWNLTLKHRSGTVTEIQCKILVGADGAGSKVRRLAGLDLNEDRHMGLALRTYARAEGLPEKTIRVDYLESIIPAFGWTFPLTGDKVNIGIGIDKRDFRDNRKRLVWYFDEYVKYLRCKGVALLDLGKIKSHPLPFGSQILPLTPKQQVALIGDAGAMIDPFTGDGIHYGISAGRLLGRLVAQCLEQEGDLQTSLASYERGYIERFAATIERSQSSREWIRFQKLFA